jgi:2'-5' RNA ligase
VLLTPRRVFIAKGAVYAGLVRLVVGVALNETAREALEQLMLRLRTRDDGLRWSSPEQWHITLAFLGSVERERMGTLVSQLHTIRSSAVPVQVEGTGVFDRAGILYAAVEVTPGLAELQRRVSATARGCGIELEERPYHPHITLARIRNRDGRRTLEHLRASLNPRRLSVRWMAEEFLLYESQLSPSGSRYRLEERFPLAKAANRGL